MGKLIDPLDALSPVDGRYRRFTARLAEWFSEHGLICCRVKTEIEYLKALIAFLQPGGRILTPEELTALDQIVVDVAKLDEAQIVKDIEVRGYESIKATNHDMKAVELYLHRKLRAADMDWLIPYVHLFCTSEDINNVAYAIQLRGALETVILPFLDQLYELLNSKALDWAAFALLGWTHGQPASPTTLGKEIRNFAARLRRQYQQLEGFELLVKLNGATGNYNAHVAAHPEKDWIGFSRQFVAQLNTDGGNGHAVRFTLNFHTTQIEPHDTYSELFQCLHRVSAILVKLCKDAWLYIARECLVQATVQGEVGSSAMPHKVNPIDWEQGEGNLQLAMMFCEFFAEKLPDSRLQRHLSDSTIIRNFGVCLGHLLVGLNGVERGLKKVSPNIPHLAQELEQHPEVVTEGYQVILRREGIADAYDRMKDVARGRKVTLEILHEFVDGLAVSDAVKAELKVITPSNYVGLAKLLARAEFDPTTAWAPGGHAPDQPQS